MAVKNYENYKRQKNRDISVISKEIEKLLGELSILKEKTIKFARNSREITAKSYGLGNSTYKKSSCIKLCSKRREILKEQH